MIAPQRLPPPKFTLTSAVFCGVITVIELVWAIGSDSWVRWVVTAVFAVLTVFAGLSYWIAVRDHRRR